MKKQQKFLSVILAVIMVVMSLPLGILASNEIVCERKEVSSFDELKAALEVTSNSSNPPERLIVLTENINYSGNEHIEITYPGTLALDLSGKNITVTSSSTVTQEKLFYLLGAGKTHFIITNTATNQSTVSFKCNAQFSSLLYCENANASFSVLGSSKDKNIVLKSEFKSITSTDTLLHLTLFLKFIDKLYISGAVIQNTTYNLSNLYFVSLPGDVLLTGNTEFNVNAPSSLASGIPVSNIFVQSVATSSSDIHLNFGGCTVEARNSGKKVLRSLDTKNTYVYSNIIKHTGDEKPDYVTIFGGTSGNVQQSGWNTNVTPTDTLKFVFSCCDDLETADLTEENTIVGHIKKCNKCGGIVSITAHNFSSSSSQYVAPTCTTAGSNGGTKCTECNYSTASEIIPALGHTEVTVAEKRATCTQTGLTEGKKCSVCEEVLVAQQEIPKTEHKNDIILSAVAATCTENGLTQGVKCSACGNITVEQTIVNATGHTEVVDERKEPTCTETGLTEGKHCSVCGVVLVKQEIIPATGHTEVEEISAKAPTCTEDGYTAKKVCSTCGQVMAQQITVTKLGHDFDTKWVIDVEATCTENGSKSHHCKRCDIKTDITVIESQGTNHSFKSEWTVDKEPTCTEDGLRSHHCRRCSATTDEEVIPAKGSHTEEVIAAVKETCETDGLTEGKRCSVCGEILIEQQTIKAHHTEVIDKAVAATCTTSGLTEGKHCCECNTVILPQSVIKATGHKETTLKAVAATCTKSGLSAGKKCSVCSAVTSAQKTVAAKGHSYKATTTKATLSANGSTVTKCTTCGVTKSNVSIAKIKSVSLSKTSFVYNGKAQKPTVTVKDNSGKTLKSGTDYTVSYSSGRKNVGQYTVTVTFKGNYSGTKKLTFNIVPKGTTVSKLTAGSKQFTVKWKKQATQTTGYEIQYSQKSNMKSAKKVTVNKTGTTSTTVKKLKSGKTYYIRIRTYKTVKISGKSVKLYSAWSAVKNVKVK